jgi:hypothetical protein
MIFPAILSPQLSRGNCKRIAGSQPVERTDLWLSVKEAVPEHSQYFVQTCSYLENFDFLGVVTI